MSPFRRFLHFTGLFIFFGLCLLMALTACIPFIHPGKFWMVSVLGLIFPYLVLLLIIIIILLAIRKTRWVILPICMLLLNFYQLKIVFALPPEASFDTVKNTDALRILSWNISRWTEGEHSMLEKQGNSYRQFMMDAIPVYGADIVCFQEFFTCGDQRYFPDNIKPMEDMGYPYYYFTPSSVIVNGLFRTGLAIFSKYPIKDSAWFNPFPGEHSEGYQFIDIDWQGKTVRIFNTHLESPGFDREATRSNRLEEFGTTFSKLKYGYSLRRLQADALKAEINRSPHPSVLVGDFSDVPNSYAYHTLKKDMQDAFLCKGSGMGKTFNSFLPNLRIDYILVDEKLEVLQFKHPELNYSDHFPQLVDVKIRN